MNGKVLVISSIKGGVGKTTSVANLGSVIAGFGKQVLLIDGNLSVPNLGIHFGLIDTEGSVHDVLAGKIEAGDAIYSISKNLDVMPGLISGKFVPKWSFKKFIEILVENYDYILIDSSPSVPELLKVLDVANSVVFVATPDYPTISSTLQLIEKVRGKIVSCGIILNMVKGKGFELSAREVADVGKMSVLGSVPYNIRVQKAVANFSPLCLNSKWNGVYRAYRKMLNKLF